MGHTLSGISSCDVNVVFVQRISTDKSDSIHRLHYLSGPAKLHFSHLWKTLARPQLESCETFLAIVRLTRFVIFTANDQNIMRIIIFVALETYVMIRIARVPVERLSDRASRNNNADHVRDVRRLLGMNRDAIVHRSVRRYYYDVCRHNRPVTGFNPSVLATCDLCRMSLAENSTAIAHYCTSKAIHVFERMKLRLSWKSQCDACIKSGKRCTCDFLNTRQSCAMRRGEFIFQQLNMIRCGGE